MASAFFLRLLPSNLILSLLLSIPRILVCMRYPISPIYTFYACCVFIGSLSLPNMIPNHLSSPDRLVSTVSSCSEFLILSSNICFSIFQIILRLIADPRIERALFPEFDLMNGLLYLLSTSLTSSGFLMAVAKCSRGSSELEQAD